MCFEGKWLQNRLRADKNESRSLSAVDIQGHQRGGFRIVPKGTDALLGLSSFANVESSSFSNASPNKTVRISTFSLPI